MAEAVYSGFDNASRDLLSAARHLELADQYSRSSDENLRRLAPKHVALSDSVFELSQQWRIIERGAVVVGQEVTV